MATNLSVMIKYSDGGFTTNCHYPGAVGGTFNGFKSRYDSYGNPADVTDPYVTTNDVVNGDPLVKFGGFSWSYSGFLESAQMAYEVDGTFTSNQRPPGRITFSTGISNGALTEAMRITAQQKLLINRTNGTSFAEKLQVVGDYSGAQDYAIVTITDETDARVAHRFANGNGAVGSITTSGTTTAFNTSSDYRLKENEIAMTGGLERLNQLQPYRFNFKADSDTTLDGFLAHEVAEIVPQAVSGEKDAMMSEDEIKPQGIDHSHLVPLLVAAVQELTAKVEALEANN